MKNLKNTAQNFVYDLFGMKLLYIWKSLFKRLVLHSKPSRSTEFQSSEVDKTCTQFQQFSLGRLATVFLASKYSD